MSLSIKEYDGIAADVVGGHLLSTSKLYYAAGKVWTWGMKKAEFKKLGIKVHDTKNVWYEWYYLIDESIARMMTISKKREAIIKLLDSIEKILLNPTIPKKHKRWAVHDIQEMIDEMKTYCDRWDLNMPSVLVVGGK